MRDEKEILRIIEDIVIDKDSTFTKTKLLIQLFIHDLIFKKNIKILGEINYFNFTSIIIHLMKLGYNPLITLNNNIKSRNNIYSYLYLLYDITPVKLVKDLPDDTTLVEDFLLSLPLEVECE